MPIIASEKVTAKASPEWAWTFLSDPFYFACWYGATPHTSWQISSEICISIGPKMKSFDQVGIVTQFTAGTCIGFKVYWPSVLLPNTPENQVELVITLFPKKDNVELLLEVTANQQWNEIFALPENYWKKLIRSLKKNIEDPYLWNQAQKQI